MKCKIHDCEMEWTPNEAHPEGGFWFCPECFAAEEAIFVETDEEYLKAYNAIMGMIRGDEP